MNKIFGKKKLLLASTYTTVARAQLSNTAVTYQNNARSLITNFNNWDNSDPSWGVSVVSGF
ncbi:MULTISPECIES: hypothetical protein [Paenibacillus]|uniref:Uncharacterized protein n=1 Tax=Paenibacillus naphthalenovorans TaxID=162209 RepID=A0A0U2N206_9BACL|nr:MULTISPECIES: hypothetical protein [Paenibacillus]ALS25087.1 hypothetical protein IJ22_48250 [Paenibacillus naphthalenovorans]GCL74807.1 hypothetical protein PN4B1_47890 [Paenibacillus naphthalenovorans]SDI36311.1 hypothetical protein SAMN05421868_105223 [Paenibacillus naphthalenovorans]